ncbi:MAG: hypothetical protein IM507_22790 [Microcystis sp. M20BS1]|uniref:hypothetical protein n=1 Tax=unclassified Microcystis TaxID=2643300 RepID=UPI00257E6659|nr:MULTISPECIES: hypothetical protein [unclassified Microcystis]MCA2626001.1 hypothetical protein [Microcystis sp. M19BS1]MCA2635103.1 hypothetical protein [Microcystis sp. M20BS1]
MTHQKELMKDWSLERQVEALSIVASNLRFFMKYNSEELMALRQSNQDAFDLFAAIVVDQIDNDQKLTQLESKPTNINRHYKERLYKIIITGKYLELSLDSKNWIDGLLKVSETNQVTNDILTWWWKGDIQKGNINLYLSDDKWNLSFLDQLKFWVMTTIVMPICTGVSIPSPLKKDFDLFRKALTLASIFLVEKGWYKEITDNTAKE